MRLYLTVLIGACLSGTNFVDAQRYAYERGSCDISIFSVLQDMVKGEVRALLNPTLRGASASKRLQYDLYTPFNPYERQIIPIGDRTALKASNFNAKWPVRFSIHGWAGKSTSCSNIAIKDAYLSRGNFNVIIVDWSVIALDINYGRISKQLSSIAASIVKFVHFLNRETGVAYENIYLVGHSAGSHIAGLTGKQLKPNRFGAIFALDPAGLNQLRLGEKFRLARDDALYVESIHTDVTLLGNPRTDISHAAFFPNWGQGQPQCPNATAAEFDFVCDHFAALYYFAESVRSPKMFGARRCRAENAARYNTIRDASCGCGNGGIGAVSASASSSVSCAADAFMGGEPAVPKSGVYYLSTATRPPFGFGATVLERPATNPNFLQSNFLPPAVRSRFYYGVQRYVSTQMA